MLLLITKLFNALFLVNYCILLLPKIIPYSLILNIELDISVLLFIHHTIQESFFKFDQQFIQSFVILF